MVGFLHVKSVPDFVMASFKMILRFGIETITEQLETIASEVVFTESGNSIRLPCFTNVSGNMTSVIPACNTFAANKTITEKTICNGKKCTDMSK